MKHTTIAQKSMHQALAGASLVGFETSPAATVAKTGEAKSGKAENQIKAGVAKSGKSAAGKRSFVVG